MHNPSVTFLMAARNAEGTIRAAVESAMAQDYDGLVRVLVVDDASTDETFREIPVMEGVDVIRNEVRLGRSGSRNRGLATIKTDLVAIQDADDVSLPNRLRSTVPLVSSEMTVVGSQLLWSAESGKLYEGAGWPTNAGNAEKVLEDFRTPVAHPTMLIPTALMRAVDGYHESFPVAEDLDLMLRLRQLHSEVTFQNSPEATVIYSRTRCDSMAYCLDSHYWRRRVMERHTGFGGGKLVWVWEAMESYLRQRLRFIRTELKPRGGSRRNIDG